MGKTKKYILLLLALCLFFSLVNLVWLAIGLLMIGLLSLMLHRLLKRTRFFLKNDFLNWLGNFVGIFALAIALRVFVFEIFTIPSSSMENSLVPGDKIIVSKLNYGPSMPRSPFEIPWVNIFFYINKEANASTDSSWWKYKRLDGFTEVETGDIVVFLHPDKKEVYYIKRCMGLPGALFEIKDGAVYLNGEAYKTPTSVKHPYNIWTKELRQLKTALDSLSPASYFYSSSGEGENRTVLLTQDEMQALRNLRWIDSIKQRTLEPDTAARAFPWHDTYLWTIDNWGPVVIPYAGMVLELNPERFILYKKAIQMHEKVNLKENAGKYYIDNKEVSTYTFKQNYYFMMGDHRSDSEDSRIWGFLPEKNIQGKAVLVLYSSNSSGFKWNRLMQPL